MYDLILEISAKRFLDKLDLFDAQRILKKLNSLEENPQLGKPLIGNLSGLWSLRVGKYRILYQIREKELIIFVVDIGHRKKSYR